MIDLNDFDLGELKRLRKNVENAITQFKDRRRRQALAEVEAFARERGLNPSDLAGIAAKRTRSPAKPKYANPADPSQTWSGRGRPPRWVGSALADGKSLEDISI